MMTESQRGTWYQHTHDSSFTAIGWAARAATLGLLSAVFFAGCVSADVYDAEKDRSLNFQRLLAQEEKRAGELGAQLRELKEVVMSLESQKHHLSVERDSLREQTGVFQYGNPPAAPPPRPAMAHARKSSAGNAAAHARAGNMETSMDPSLSEDSLSEFGLSDMPFEDSGFHDEAGGHSGALAYHIVRQGDTLYRLARSYGVTLDQLEVWNHLTDINHISPGQRLVVGTH